MKVEIKRAEPRTQVAELSTNGPIMDQWNAPPTPNGLPSTVAAPSTPVVVTSYPNWGAVAVSAPVIATQQSPLISQPFTILSAGVYILQSLVSKNSTYYDYKYLKT